MGKLDLKLTGGVLGDAFENFTIENIGIAQGHAGAANNWWFGGTNCEIEESVPNTVRCTGTSRRGTWNFFFRRGGNGVNVIDITQIVEC